MKKRYFIPIVLLFQIVFSQNDKDISFLHPHCMGEVAKNEMNEYWAFFEIEKDNRNYYDVEKYDETDSRKPKFFLKGLNFEESPIVGKWVNRMIFPGEYLSLSIPNMEDEKNRNSYYIYAKGDLVETENNEFPYFERLDNYELRILLKNKDSLIYSLDSISAWSAGGFEGGVFLYWMGDLNGDKQIDMILGASKDYRSQSYLLLLSNENPEEMFTQYEVGGCSSC